MQFKALTELDLYERYLGRVPHRTGADLERFAGRAADAFLAIDGSRSAL